MYSNSFLVYTFTYPNIIYIFTILDEMDQTTMNWIDLDHTWNDIQKEINEIFKTIFK